MIKRKGNKAAVIFCAAFMVLLWAAASASGGPITTPHAHDSDLHQAVHDAAHAVDEAWEVFHQAALSGTLSSPAIQAEIEKHLHDSRTLLLDARKALDQDDRETVERIVHKIHELTTQAIKLSREKKR